MRLGIVLGIIVGVIITVIAAVVIVMLLVLPATRQVVSEMSTPAPTSTSIPATVSSTPAQIPPTQSPNGKADVDFSLNIPSVVVSGISSAKISAQLTNTGSDDAHNVTGKIEVFSQGSRIKINKQDYVSLPLGDMAARVTITREIELSFGLFDGIKVSQNGATFTLTLSSDEKNQTMSYDYRP